MDQEITMLSEQSTLKEGCPPPKKQTSYHHLIGLAEIYLSEHDHQMANMNILAGF